MVAIATILLGAWFIFRPDNSTVNHDLFNIEMISELTTIECRYHNVAVRDNKGNFLGVGEQYVWFEYDVKVNAGIDMNQAKIEEPTTDGIVRIHLPPSKIQGIIEIEETKKNPVRELGFMTKLTVEEEDEIFRKATEKFETDAQMKEVLVAARENTKNILEQYVKNIGELVGEKYTVEWVEEEDLQQTIDTEKEEKEDKK